MPFGRFKGQAVRDIPTWYLSGCEMDRPKITATWLKEAIRFELQRRKSGSSRGGVDLSDVNRMFSELAGGGS